MTPTDRLKQYKGQSSIKITERVRPTTSFQISRIIEFNKIIAQNSIQNPTLQEILTKLKSVPSICLIDNTLVRACPILFLSYIISFFQSYIVPEAFTAFNQTNEVIKFHTLLHSPP